MVSSLHTSRSGGPRVPGVCRDFLNVFNGKTRPGSSWCVDISAASQSVSKKETPISHQ